MISLDAKEKKLLEIVFKHAIYNGNGYKSIRSRYLAHSGTPKDDKDLKRDLYILENKLDDYFEENYADNNWLQVGT